MKQIFYLIIISTFFFSIQRCNSIEPPDEDKPGRRDYVWTVDTLVVPEGRSIPYWMWGANENDIWAVGTSYTNAYAIWHYDGNRWSNYVPDQYIDPRGLWGTSSSNIWTGSTDGSLWHYNGVKWSKFTEFNIPGYRPFIINGLTGSVSNNIYAIGFADSIDGITYKGIVLHYDGIKWELLNIPVYRNSFTQIEFAGDLNEYIIKGNVFGEPIEFLYKINKSRLEEFSNNSGSEGNISLNRIGETVYTVSQEKIYKYSNSKLNIIKDFTGTQYAGKVWGRNEMDFFTINWDGIGHYNGTDLITIYPKWNNDWFPGGAVIFEKDVFFIWDDSFNTFIVHGKLIN